MDMTTLAIALSKISQVKNELLHEISNFKFQVEKDRSILNNTGKEKVFYFVPKTASKPQDGYDEFIYVNNSWEQVGATDIDLSAYALKSEITQEVYIGSQPPSGDEVLWIDTSGGV